MKNIFILTILLTVTLLAGVIREGSLQARSDGTNVIVQWGSADEASVKSYEVERRSGTADGFVWIASVPKKGSNSFYEYVDKSAFKASGTIYHYRIKIVLKSGSAEYSSVIVVSHNVSSVKRTWGSLKAMFR